MYGGADLNMGGMTGYCHDILYVSTFVQVGQTVAPGTPGGWRVEKGGLAAAHLSPLLALPGWRWSNPAPAT